MLVHLQVEGGPHVGRRIDLKSGQAAVFGNSGWVDFCFEDDTVMSGKHFELTVLANACQFKRVDPKGKSLINGTEADHAELSNGDLVEAGLTSIRVQLDRQSVDDIPIEPLAPAVDIGGTEELEDLPALCDYLGLSEEAKPCASGCENRDDLIQALRQAKLFEDAIRIQVHALATPSAVTWAVGVISELAAKELSPTDLEAVDSASQWATDPTEENRRLVESRAEAIKFKGIAGAVSAGAFYSGGSIASEDLEHDVEPDPRTAGQAITVALTLAVATQPAADAERIYGEVLDRAIEPG